MVIEGDFLRKLTNVCLCLEHITQSVVKSHIETSQHSTEELKRMAWTLYSPEETRSYQTKVCETFHFHWHMIVEPHIFTLQKLRPRKSPLSAWMFEMYLTNMYYLEVSYMNK